MSVDPFFKTIEQCETIDELKACVAQRPAAIWYQVALEAIIDRAVEITEANAPTPIGAKGFLTGPRCEGPQVQP
jgi:hypothetical protein